MGVSWIHLARVTDKRQAVTNAVMNLPVIYKLGNFLTSRAAIGF